MFNSFFTDFFHFANAKQDVWQKVSSEFVVALLEQDNAVSERKVVAHLFFGESCPHCHREILFLQNLKTRFPELEVVGWEI